MSGQSRPRWRLLDTGPADGFTNMAIDEAILEVYAAEGGLPTLRFYTWSPPTLSLGYSQPLASDIDLTQCRALGIDVVRRPTGGRAVLHDHELTYNVVIRADDPRVTSGVLAAYLTISQALIRGLSYLGIAAELLPLRRGAFLPSDDARGVIMQHGSVPISHDVDKMRAVFSSPPRGSRSAHRELEYQAHMTSLQEAGGSVYHYAEVVEALTRGIAEAWEVDLLPGQLTAAERQLSAHLCATKYRSEAWTWHR
jgi:lipoyl(octanoyl) transferase